MADGVLLPATGTGSADITVAADEIGGAKYQRVKLSLGADGTAADAGVGEGAATGALRVDLATDGTVIGTVTETAPTTDTASSGLNGRLQRIAQRLTSLIAVALGTAVTSTALSNVAASASSTTVLAANANRRSAQIYNDSTAGLYLKFGATASTTSFTVLIPAGGYYELPLPIYAGVLDGIWSAANGSARVTEGV